jgi:hypothetical protein
MIHPTQLALPPITLPRKLKKKKPPDSNPVHAPQPVLVVLGIILTVFAVRRRRNRQANLAYIQQTQPGTGAMYGSPYNTAGGPPPFVPQYPPPAHNGVDSPYVYNPSSGFAPVRGHYFRFISLRPLSLTSMSPTLSFVAYDHAATVLYAPTWHAPGQRPEMKPENCNISSGCFGDCRPYVLFIPSVSVVPFQLGIPLVTCLPINFAKCYLRAFDVF